LVEALIFAERFDEAKALIEAQLHAARARSAASLLPFPLYARSDIDVRKGNIVDARADSDEALTLGELTGFRGMQGLAHGLCARAAALEGDEDSCRQHAAKAADLASRLKQRPPELFLNHALGLLELSRGQPVIAAEHLRRNVELENSIGVGTPAVVPWRADYIEALARGGQRHQAMEALDDLERQGRAAQSPWAAAVVSRCRVLLAEGDWETHGEQAIADLANLPFEQGRAQLILGEQLRRNQQPNKARRHLRAATETLTGCGATPWMARAQEELRAAGGRTTNRAAPGQPLTHQELQVSRLAADGATNKEIAAALFISQKTVEYHLQKAFAKLGATNRTHAARLLRHTESPAKNAITSSPPQP
jgi:DNA-binding CsgD family transcriptional regulator